MQHAKFAEADPNVSERDGFQDNRRETTNEELVKRIRGNVPFKLSSPPSLPTNGTSTLDDFPVPSVSVFPTRVTGRLFGVSKKNEEEDKKHPGYEFGFTCTASVITSTGQSAIVSAGHCAYTEEEGFAHDLIFVPAYEDGRAPYGKWEVGSYYVPQGWLYTQEYPYDMSAMTLRPNQAGQRIEQVVGAWGYTFLTTPEQFHETIGYPAAPTNLYNGETMIGCETQFVEVEKGSWSGVDGSFGVSPCYQTHGASGGPWLTSSGEIQAVDSHGFCETEKKDCGEPFGTYFGATALTLYKTVQAEAPGPFSSACPSLKRQTDSLSKGSARDPAARRKLRKLLTKYEHECQIFVGVAGS